MFALPSRRVEPAPHGGRRGASGSPCERVASQSHSDTNLFRNIRQRSNIGGESQRETSITRAQPARRGGYPQDSVTPAPKLAQGLHRAAHAIGPIPGAEVLRSSLFFCLLQSSHCFWFPVSCPSCQVSWQRLVSRLSEVERNPSSLRR